LSNERIKITKKTNVSGSNFKSNTLILFDSIFTYIRKHRTINNILRLKIREGKNEIEKEYILYILVTNSSVEANDEFIFLRSEVSSLKIRSEVINPSESATFTTSSQTCSKHAII
jgi:hypothetical protein